MSSFTCPSNWVESCISVGFYFSEGKKKKRGLCITLWCETHPKWVEVGIVNEALR